MHEHAGLVHVCTRSHTCLYSLSWALWNLAGGGWGGGARDVLRAFWGEARKRS
ncbi:unnamed protein product [Nyctereutes procyonoides]|uniref:(raccoon dog) hypothetical protein n=1 Tax=Nyctereutes procyonoides TaxID=34880 RepID=A0A811YJQ6_NYCPR|nr:unnamed protein product [Nyctereutes procyonoides]